MKANEACQKIIEIYKSEFDSDIDASIKKKSTSVKREINESFSSMLSEHFQNEGFVVSIDKKSNYPHVYLSIFWGPDKENYSLPPEDV